MMPRFCDCTRNCVPILPLTSNLSSAALLWLWRTWLRIAGCPQRDTFSRTQHYIPLAWHCFQELPAGELAVCGCINARLGTTCDMVDAPSTWPILRAYNNFAH